VRTELIDMQREYREKQSHIHVLENERNGIEIDAARLEERALNLSREMDEALKTSAVEIRTHRGHMEKDPDALFPEIQRLRYKLELIGGIDPEIIKEYDETKTRFDFLDAQLTDLHEAIRSTEKIIQELDEDIHEQSKKVFGQIQKEFERYFRILFGGGSCSLVKLTREEVEEVGEAEEVIEEGVAFDRSLKDTGGLERDRSEVIAKRIQQYDDGVVGIDIQATPPGKKLKSLNLLSGGERALTSIALLSAIMAVNPAPFVVLDEVDAALDESNTLRFAAILDDLSKKSQFIVVTHNRATMEKADILYGVTMGDDGVSNLLGVKLEEVASGATARR